MAARRGAPKGRKGQIPWRKDREILDRMERVERLHVGGMSCRAIAKSIGVNERTIRLDVGRLTELWIERVGATQEEHRAKAAAVLEEVTRRAFAAAEFDQWCERAVLFGEDVDLDGDGTMHPVQRGKDGDASFKGQKVAALNLARQSIMDWAKLMGVVVDKVAQTDGEGNDLSLADLAARAREARAEREAAAAAHR